ncbi:MAG TPA: RMD1 family protein, partial [bacterium]|nr:RMD1 family protein [bacterium]
MKIKIRAFDLGENIDFSKLSNALGVMQVTKWEDPLIVDYLDNRVFIYQFGAIVFLNHTEKESFDFIEELQTKIFKKFNFGRTDTIDYSIVSSAPASEIKNWNDEEFYFDHYDETIYFNANFFSEKYLKIIAFTIAQSVVLDRYNKLSEELEEEVERILNWFKRYKKILPILTNRALDKTIKVLKLRHNIISDLMILDKPALTWENTAFDEFYNVLSNHLELTRRYRTISSKLDYALDTAQSLSGMSE